MVEKIDRPEAPPPYRITKAKESREDQHQSSYNQREEQEKQYQKQLEGNEWEKFERRTMVIKPVRVPRARIDRLLFRAAKLHSGTGILQVDVVWRDGRQTRGALVLLTHLEDFIRTKRFKPGETVPDSLWAHGTTIELGIPQRVGEAKRRPGKPSGAGAKQAPSKGSLARALPRWLGAIGLIDRSTGKVSWGVMLLYLFLLGMTITVIVLEYSEP